MLSSASTRYAHRDDAFSAAHRLECASPKWTCTTEWHVKFHTTDWPTDQPPRTLGRPSQTGVRVGWIEKRTEVQRRWTGSQTPPKMGLSAFRAEIPRSSRPYEHRLSYRSESIPILRIFSIFQNIARNISPNYKANEIKLGSLLVPPSI